MTALLEGLRVVEGSAFVAAPLGGMTLAQLGADVIRVDPLAGGPDHGRWPLTAGGQSLFWAGLNKGKRSVTVDLRSAEGRELVRALATAPGPDAGLLLTNLPGRGWLDYDELARRRADLIALVIVGDHDGSPAVDYTVNARSGFPMVTGPAGTEGPVNHVLPAWDAIAGGMAATALLAAERHRSRTGEGQRLTLALADVALAMVGHLGRLAQAQVEHEEAERDGNYLYGAFGRDFSTRDGRRLMIVAITVRQWRGLVQATDIEHSVADVERRLGLDFDDEGDRYRGRAEISALVEEWARARDLVTAGEALDAAGALWAPYQGFRELVAHDPRCSPANPMFEERYQPGVGAHLMPGTPLASDRLARLPVRRAPLLGEHTGEVLAEVLGLSDAELGRLGAAGLIGAPG